ncbi:MAG TPA: hypothetical protein VK968_12835 [Roseimicrobium sp.]|nr:hypothetical protein [Roseimicrobium sp.]
MSTSALPDDVRRFILTSVPSVPYMEAMLLLRRGAAEPWNAAKVARHLYVPESQAQKLLADLRGAGVAGTREAQEFGYAPAPELVRMIDALALCHAAHLMEITALIHSRTDRRALQFADAFRLRRPGA